MYSFYLFTLIQCLVLANSLLDTSFKGDKGTDKNLLKNKKTTDQLKILPEPYEKQFRKVFPQIFTSTSPSISPSPSSSATTTPSISITPTSSVTPTPSSSQSPSASPTVSPSKSPSPTPFRNRKTPNLPTTPSRSPNPNKIFIGSESFEVPVDGSETLKTIKISEFPGMELFGGSLNIGDTIILDNVVVDGDFSTNVRTSSRNLLFESLNQETAVRQSNSFSSLQLIVNGATHILSSDAECAGALQSVLSPLLFNIPLTDVGDGSPGIEIVYKIVGEYGNTCIPEFGFDISVLALFADSLRPLHSEIGSFSSYNYPSHFLREKDNEDIFLSDRREEKLVIVAEESLSLTKNAISFRVLGTNKYLRHSGFILKAQEREESKIFHLDASFIKRTPLVGGDSGVSLESVNFPGRFIRHSQFNLRLDEVSRETTFKKDATWKWELSHELFLRPLIDEEGYLTASNFLSFYLKAKPDDSILISEDQQDKLLLVAERSLYTTDNGISFRVHGTDKYLRHISYALYAQKVSNDDTFRKDATFFKRNALNGEKRSTSFESLNFPGYYIRHRHQGVYLEKPGTEHFSDDASWQWIFYSAFFLRPWPYDEGYMLAANRERFFFQENAKGNVVISDSEAEKIAIVAEPALYHSENTISFRIRGTNRYLVQHEKHLNQFQVTSFTLQFQESSGTEKFEKSATFTKHQALTGSDESLSFESLSSPGYFIRHYHRGVRLDPAENSQLYEEESSWIWVFSSSYNLHPKPYERGSIMAANYRTYYMQENHAGNIVISTNKIRKSDIVAVPPLYMAESGISFKIHGTNKYLRHQDFNIEIHEYENAQLFKQDATFIKQKSLNNEDDSLSFEALNVAGYFIRHLHQGVRIDRLSESGSFRDDATWKWFESTMFALEPWPYEIGYLLSSEFPSHYLQRNCDGITVISAENICQNRIDLVPVPPLHKIDAGISMQVDGTNHYLVRHNNKLKISGPDGTERFRKDATFLKQSGLNGRNAETSFESANVRDSFIRHKHVGLLKGQRVLEIQKKTDSNTFNADATWLWKTPTPSPSPSPSTPAWIEDEDGYFSHCSGYGNHYIGCTIRSIEYDFRSSFISAKLCMDLCIITHECTHFFFDPSLEKVDQCDLRTYNVEKYQVINRIEGDKTCGLRKNNEPSWRVPASRWQFDDFFFAKNCEFAASTLYREMYNEQDFRCTYLCQREAQCTHYDFKEWKECPFFRPCRTKRRCRLMQGKNIRLRDAFDIHGDNRNCGVVSRSRKLRKRMNSLYT